jgi:hypothetical protein
MLMGGLCWTQPLIFRSQNKGLHQLYQCEFLYFSEVPLYALNQGGWASIKDFKM